MQNKIFTISGPGASGKESIINELIKKDESLIRAMTYNTRNLRPGEENTGRIFVTKEEFLKLKNGGKLIESNFLNGCWYGASKKHVDEILESGGSVLMELDINGIREIKKQYNNVISFYLDVDFEDLRKRFITRGQDSETTIENRLNIAEAENKRSSICEHKVKNEQDKLDQCVEEIYTIIKSFKEES